MTCSDIDSQHQTRHRESCQIEEIRVLTKRIVDISVAELQSRSRDDNELISWEMRDESCEVWMHTEIV
jgi:hypothetical protein